MSPGRESVLSRFKLFVGVVVALVLVAAVANAQTELANVARSKPVSCDRTGTALSGYDVVSFYDYDEPVRGERTTYSDLGDGMRFYFASKVTKTKFEKDPERYIPAFGGYCALSLGIEPGELEDRNPGLYKADPSVYVLENGRLYFFSSPEAREMWKKNRDTYFTRAESNWALIWKERQSD